MPAREALAKRLVLKGLGGHDRSIEQLLKLDSQLAGGSMPVEVADSGVESLTPGERATLEDYNRRIIEEHELAKRAGGDHEPGDGGGSA
jgi:hypothetical protein